MKEKLHSNRANGAHRKEAEEDWGKTVMGLEEQLLRGISQIEDKAGEKGYKLDCYDKYITKAPIEEQLRDVKKLSLKHYDMVLAFEPTNEEALEFRPKVDNETVKSWSFCAD